MLRKRLTKDLMNKFSILSGAKLFSLGILCRSSFFLLDMTFKGCCLMKNNIPIPEKVTNLYIYYTLNPRLRNLNRSFTLGICLFGSVMLPKNVVPDKENYTSYSIGFHSRSEFSLPGVTMVKM